MTMRLYEEHAKLAVFGRRVDEARGLLGEASKRGRPVVAMSWGKDSCVLGHLALEVLGKVEMMHMACAHELPGGDKVVEYFKSRTVVHELPPLNTLAESIEWLRGVGLPHEREQSAHRKIIKTRKKDRAEDWAKEHGFSVTILGMRAEEAKGRRSCFRARTPVYQLKTGHWMANPLAWWTSRDVWAYLVTRGIPWHPLYDCETHGYNRERLRSGGWLYTDGAHDGQIAWLRRHYRAEWRKLVTAFPRMTLFG